MSTTEIDHGGGSAHEDAIGHDSQAEMTDSPSNALPTFRVAALEGSTTVGQVEGGDATLPGRVARFLEHVSETIEERQQAKRTLHVPPG